MMETPLNISGQLSLKSARMMPTLARQLVGLRRFKWKTAMSKMELSATSPNPVQANATSDAVVSSSPIRTPVITKNELFVAYTVYFDCTFDWK